MSRTDCVPDALKIAQREAELALETLHVPACRSELATLVHNGADAVIQITRWALSLMNGDMPTTTQKWLMGARNLLLNRIMLEHLKRIKRHGIDCTDPDQHLSMLLELEGVLQIPDVHSFSRNSRYGSIHESGHKIPKEGPRTDPYKPKRPTLQHLPWLDAGLWMLKRVAINSISGGEPPIYKAAVYPTSGIYQILPSYSTDDTGGYPSAPRHGIIFYEDDPGVPSTFQPHHLSSHTSHIFSDYQGGFIDARSLEWKDGPTECTEGTVVECLKWFKEKYVDVA